MKENKKIVIYAILGNIDAMAQTNIFPEPENASYLTITVQHIWNHKIFIGCCVILSSAKLYVVCVQNNV